MRILKGVIAFALTFCMLAVTVVCAAMVGDENGYISETTDETFCIGETVNPEDIPMLTEDDSEYSPRLTAPSRDNPYYYSNKNVFYKWGYGMPNCTAYAYGRAYEILGKEPDLCIYDANQWFDYNKDNNIYAYGNTPKLGAIVCFKYSGYNSGHVAVVEKIVGDTVYYSNSAWSGNEFYLTSSPIDDPADGRSGWIFQGFIYIGEFCAGKDDGDIYKITSDTGVNMRSDAGTSHSLVGAIPYGKIVVVTETKEQGGYTWGYTTYNDVSGWFVTDFAQLIVDSDKPTEKPTDTPSETETQTPLGVLGDADLDGELSVLDATQIQLYMASLVEFDGTQLVLADMDKDGEVSVLDATKICLGLAGLE